MQNNYPQPKPPQRKKYEFETKRILLTRDPKDRSIKGKCIGIYIHKFI